MSLLEINKYVNRIFLKKSFPLSYRPERGGISWRTGRGERGSRKKTLREVGKVPVSLSVSHLWSRGRLDILVTLKASMPGMFRIPFLAQLLSFPP
jgi:hypothetical protein